MSHQEARSLREYNRLFRKYDSIWHELALTLELSDSALAILYRVLEEGGDCLQKELVESVSLSKQTVHSSIQRLRDQGLLTLDREKARSQRLRLTPAGQRLAEEKILPLMELETGAFRELGEEDSRRLLSLTARYLTIFEKNAKEYRNRTATPRSPLKGRGEGEKGI